MAKTPTNRRLKVIPFELSILAGGIGGDDPSSEWMPFVNGAFTYVEGAPIVPFSGFMAGTTSPVIGEFKNAPAQMFATYSKKVGRPTEVMRDVAVFLAYTYFEFANPTLNKTALRKVVCDAWAGEIPELKPADRLHGILIPDHVKRSMKRACEFAPALRERVRISKYLHLFGGDTLAGALIHVISPDHKPSRMIFEPSLKGLAGEPYTHYGFDGWLFRDVSGWEWKFGEARASPINISACWRPAVGTIKVSPVFGASSRVRGGQQ